MLFRNLSSFQEKNKVYQQVEQVFSENPQVWLIPEITESTLREYPFLKPIYAEGARSLIIFPLFNDKELLGTLEITSHQPGKLNQNYSNKILPAISLFILALEKSAKNLANEIDHAIKEQFTAVQTSVEWRFTEAALRFISESRKNEDAKIEPIVFENVYPLYGAIDLRNSSTERTRADFFAGAVHYFTGAHTAAQIAHPQYHRVDHRGNGDRGERLRHHPEKQYRPVRQSRAAVHHVPCRA